MKQWVVKLLEQFDFDWTDSGKKNKTKVDLNEDKATLLYIIDVYNRHLIDIDRHPVRKVRETLDSFAKHLVDPENPSAQDVLFRFRQFFSSYRIDEYSYVQNSFDDFKRIIWDFADQLSEEIRTEKAKDDEIKNSLEQLKEAVESNSIEALRTKSKEFINYYIEHHSKKDEKREKRITVVRKNLNSMKKQLFEANQNMMLDHLTKAHNRKSFDEQMKKHVSMFAISKAPVTLIMMDIDFFKKINDQYGHDIGDFVLKECVILLQEYFTGHGEFVARIGGEEFAVILPDTVLSQAIHKVEGALNRIRKEVFVQGSMQLKFTVSMGLAQLLDDETLDQWIKRADTALYESKNTGRDKYTVAPHPAKLVSVA